MNSTNESAMRLALEALNKLTDAADEFSVSGVYFNEGIWEQECLNNSYEAIKALEETLASEQEQPKVRTGNCLLTGVCASEGHKIQVKQEQRSDSEHTGEPVAYGMRDTMIGNGNRMMYVRLDKGQDGCTVPLYEHPQPKTEQEQGEPVAWACWLDSQNPKTDKPVVVQYEPLAYSKRRPLTYITPQQPSTIVRKPLTNEQVTQLWAHIPEPSLRKALTVFARAIEAAHSITASEAEDSARSKT